MTETKWSQMKHKCEILEENTYEYYTCTSILIFYV